MATKLALFLRKRPVVLVAVLVAASILGAFFGHGGHHVGLWDGPI